MVPLMSVEALVEWVERGLALQVGNSTVCAAPGGILWHEYFLDYSDGIVIDQKRVESREESVRSLKQANDETLTQCLERAHRAAALTAAVTGELAEARGHAERVHSLRVKLEAQRLQSYRALLPSLHRKGEALDACRGRLSENLGIDVGRDADVFEEAVLKALLSAKAGQ